MHDRLRDIVAGGVSAAIRRMREANLRPLLCIGEDLPFALLRAGGFAPIVVQADAERPTPFADALGLGISLGRRARGLLQVIADVGGDADGLVMSHADAATPQVFATLRELPQLGRNAQNTWFCDLLHRPDSATRRYNASRLRALAQWLGGDMRDDGLARALAADDDIAMRVATVDARRRAGTLTGATAHLIDRVGDLLPSDAFAAVLREAADLPGEDLAGARILTTGSPIPDELRGLSIVAEHATPGTRWRTARTMRGDPFDRLLDRAASWPAGSFAGIARYRESLARLLAEAAPDLVVHYADVEDEGVPWTAEPARRLCAERGVAFLALDPRGDMTAQISAAIGKSPASSATDKAPPRGPVPRRPDTVSRKSLASVADFNRYQRAWFDDTRARAAAGEPFAVVNANAPQEMLRALDIPYVVNQWWASIVAAKQQSPRYAALLRAHGLPADIEAYSAQGIAAVFDDGIEGRPWGGLPKPTMLHAVAESDATRGLFDRWAETTGADLYLYDYSIESRWDVPGDWWNTLHDDWEDALETPRLDLLAAQLHDAVARIAAATGRRFDPERFAEVMDLVNEQEEYYRRTRDLIAVTRPAPVSVVDTMPATMVPQWHRGTTWARDAAKAFYEEVRALAEAGHAACPGERVRLMWVGRGLWSQMGFYQRWEASHGAVFVWSMYLALAADGYIRRFAGGRDPMRALAARFLTMGDELRMPTWAGAWHVKEARSNGIDGAVALDDADPMVLAALERIGIPVLRLPMSNFDADALDSQDAAIARFIEAISPQRHGATGRSPSPRP